MSDTLPTEFRKKHGRKIVLGTGSAGLGAVLAMFWPQIQNTLTGIMDARAVTVRLDAYEARAHRLEAEQDALRGHIESLKQSRDYQQGLLDGMLQLNERK